MRSVLMPVRRGGEERAWPAGVRGRLPRGGARQRPARDSPSSIWRKIGKILADFRNIL